MSKTILFAGKEFPDGKDFATSAAFQARKVIVTCGVKIDENGDEKLDADIEKLRQNNIKTFSWNRGSVLSARSLVINCENEGGADEAVLVFDEHQFAVKFGSSYENSRILEELIGSYEYLAQELVSRFSRDQKRKRKLVFLYKSNPTICESVTSNSLRSPVIQLSYSLVAAAGGAFRAFAENMAAELVQSENITPLLVSCDYTNDLAGRDNSISVWLCNYLDSVDALKKPLSPKQKVSWIKVGARSPGGFGLF